jgi:hypothetical protein
LTTTSGQARFLVDDTGGVVEVSFTLTPTAEPCQVRFSLPADGRPCWEPSKITVDYGGRPFATFLVEKHAS